ncbi:hypothetical protein IT413_01495 [Candidatus Peregrinibacteria bacterium]|nr:hypothetical protein [Candidatus Peregrinibacteria bacterium]
MSNTEKIKAVKEIILSSSPHWSIRGEDSDTVYFLYKEDDKKANCGTACLLGLILLPLSIIYAILGGKKGKTGVITIKIVQDKINITGDLKFALKAFKTLRKNHDINRYIEENETIKKAKNAEVINAIVMIVLIVVIFAIYSKLLLRN